MPTGTGPIEKPTYRRLPRDRFAGLPGALKVRLVDRKVYDRRHAHGRCEWPGCTHRGPVDCAHVKTRGSGGDDSDGNTVSLCRRHHSEQEAMGERGKVILRRIIAAR